MGNTVTLSTGQQATCTIVNTAVAPRLTLIKQVVNTSGGTAVPRDWTLSATGPVTIQGLVGDASITDAQVRVGTYSLFESGGPSGYTPSQFVCTGAASTNPATGTVTLAAGNAATCTITNTDQPARLTLRKVVDAAASGSGRVPADWTLTATPVAIAGQGPVSGNGDPTTAGGVNAVSVFSGSYDLTESGPTGFTPGTWVCQGGVLTAARVVVPPGGAVDCTITNTAVTPTLTLVKVVDNGTTGATTPATAWMLTADGPTPISGSTGSAAVTAAPVRVGTYTLSESGPLGYTASAWVCTGGASSTATSVTLAEGQARQLHDHQHGRRASAHAGEGRGQRHDRRHGRRHRLDAERHRTDHDLRPHRRGGGDRRRRAGRVVHARRDRGACRLPGLDLELRRRHLRGWQRHAGRW